MSCFELTLLNTFFEQPFCKKSYKYFAMALKGVFVNCFMIKVMHKKLYTLRENQYPSVTEQKAKGLSVWKG